MNLQNQLQERLLAIGGTVIHGLEDPNAPKTTSLLLEHGEVCGEPVLLAPTDIKGGCHVGTLALFLLSNRRIEVWTGYALAPDWHPNAGVWSEHSWAKCEGVLLETTPIPRDIYFGFQHPNPVPWAEYELRKAELWREDPKGYLELFSSECWGALLHLIHAEPAE